MCGIIAEFNTTLEKGKKKREKAVKAGYANDFIISQYEDQHSRGERGFGIIRITDKAKIELDRATEPIKFLLDLNLKKAKAIIAHHRAPTSTDNKMDQTHPMYVSNEMLQYDYCVVHNGVIRNDKELYDKHKAMGFEYTTEYQEYSSYYSGYNQDSKLKFNDSEALAIELALVIEKKQKEVETDNTAAFIVLQVNKTNHKALKVFYGKSTATADLKMFKTRGKMQISSEGPGEEIKDGIMYSFDIGDKNMTIHGQKLEFKKKESVVVIENTSHHHVSCQCSKCLISRSEKTEMTSEGKGEIKTIQLPYTQEVNKTDTGGTEARVWTDMDTIVEMNYNNDIYVDKTYEGLKADEFKKEIKDFDSDEIYQAIDDKLDEEIDHMKELLDSWKQTIMDINNTGPEVKGFYLRQFAVIMKSMQNLTNIAENEYNEKQLIEEEAEAEKDAEEAAIQREVDEYNVGFRYSSEECGGETEEKGYSSKDIKHYSGARRHLWGDDDDDNIPF